MTGDDGTAAFTADLPIGFSYCVKEEQAPEGYLRNTKDVYSFAFSYTNDSEAVVSFSHTFTNERVNAKISLHKKDAETNQAVPQGDATLENAVYGLYAREDIVHPDGATGVIYKAGEKVTTLTTDEHGKASVENLYLGSYYVKEITPPTGYLADENEYDLVCSYEGDLVATVERECTSQEQVVKQPFQIIKAADNGKTDADLLSGAGFTAYLVSSLSVKEDGNYDFSSATPVVIGEMVRQKSLRMKKAMPAVLQSHTVHISSVRQRHRTIILRWMILLSVLRSIIQTRRRYGGYFWTMNLKQS